MAQPAFVDIGGQQSLGRPSQPLLTRHISPAYCPLMMLLMLPMAKPGLCLLMLDASLVPLLLLMLQRTCCLHTLGLRLPMPLYAGTLQYTRRRRLTAQSLLLLGRHAASPESSLHSSIQHWLQTTELMVPPPSAVESAPSSGYPGRLPTLPVGTEAATLAPRAPRTSHVSHSSRRTRRSVASSMAAEIFGF